MIRDDGKGHRYEDEGYHAINIRMGTNTGTSSWGCQTLPPEDWQSFITPVYAEMRRAAQLTIPYCLMTGRRADAFLGNLTHKPVSRRTKILFCLLAMRFHLRSIAGDFRGIVRAVFHKSCS